MAILVIWRFVAIDYASYIWMREQGKDAAITGAFMFLLILFTGIRLKTQAKKEKFQIEELKKIQKFCAKNKSYEWPDDEKRPKGFGLPYGGNKPEK